MSGAFEGWAKKSNPSEFHNERVFSVRRAFPYDRTITLSHLWTFILKLFQWDSKLFAQPIPSTTFIESIHFTSIHIDDSVNTHTDSENRSLGGFALSHEKWKKKPHIDNAKASRISCTSHTIPFWGYSRIFPPYGHMHRSLSCRSMIMAAMYIVLSLSCVG